MINHDNIHFHNCGELVASSLRHGLRMQRVPEAVRQQLDPATQRAILAGNGVELRFRMAQGWVNNEIILSSLHRTYAYVYHGDFKQTPGFRFEIGPSPTVVTVIKPDRLDRMPPDRAAQSRFAPELIRIVLGGEAGPVYFHGSTLPAEAPRAHRCPAGNAAGLRHFHHGGASRLYSVTARLSRKDGPGPQV